MTYLAMQDEKNQSPAYPEYEVPGKDKKLTYDRQVGLWHIKWTNGGELPKELTGKFTSQTLVTAEIEKYINNIAKDTKTEPVVSPETKPEVKTEDKPVEVKTEKQTEELLPIVDNSKSVKKRVPKRKLTPKE